MVTIVFTQVPPLHWGLTIPPLAVEQAVVPQAVPSAYTAHLPAPSQLPVVPQLVGAMIGQAASTVPAGTGAQVPSLPLTPHDWQLPHAATAQQKPSVQWPLAHAPSLVQAVPPASSVLHVPPWQTDGAVQSASAMQVVLHPAAVQANGRHTVVVAAPQVPAPSQVAAAVKVPAAHEAPLQVVPFA